MGLREFFKVRKEEKEVRKIIEKVRKHKIPSDLVTQAISYRRLGQYELAIKTLNKVLTEYSYYLPAKVVLGVTLSEMGKIDEAEQQFKRILSEYPDGKQIPLIEVYANLGSLYYFKRNDIATALNYYRLALSTPQVEKYGSEGNSIFISNVHRDLSYIYFIEHKYDLAKKHARLSLRLNNNCHISSMVLGLSLLNEFMISSEIMNYFTQKIESNSLIEAVKFIKESLSTYPNNYLSISGIVTALYLLSNMPFYKDDLNMSEWINKEQNKYSSILETDSQSSEEAKYYFDRYNETVLSFGAQIIQAKFPGTKIEFK